MVIKLKKQQQQRFGHKPNKKESNIERNMKMYPEES